MSSMNVKYLFSPLLLALTLTGCGGGGPADGDPALGSANPDANLSPGDVDSSGSDQTSAASISGRVADGYIRGALVCIDINENQACDTDEPSATTGAGGRYELSIPAAGVGKPIIAAIPADAIDEDTGKLVGQELVFTAPGDRPTFISPITTLVQEELQNNPGLDLDSAEVVVKSALGLNVDGEVSLFEDYIAKGVDSQDNRNADEFRYLHSTARVVASLLGDIQANVEASATEKGLDVKGDLATQRAIREIVRTEVRALLPEIAKEVAALESAESATTEPTASDADSTGPSAINADGIAERLFPKDRLTDIEDRIESTIERPELQHASMQLLLSEGMYSMDVDCRPLDRTEAPVSYAIPVDENGEPVFLPEEGKAEGDVVDHEQTAYPHQEFSFECETEYMHVMLDESGESIETEQFFYDAGLALWVKHVDDENRKNHNFVLVSGHWIPMTDTGPAGPVKFTDDGGAAITTRSGSMNIRGVTLDVSATPVQYHLWERVGLFGQTESVEESLLFAEDAKINILTVEQRSPEHVLFNHTAEHSHDEDSRCDLYAGNCNVIHILSEESAQAATSLDLIREGAVGGIDLTRLGHDEYTGRPLVLTLNGDLNEDGTNPHGGSASWSGGRPEHPGEYEFAQRPDGLEYPLDGQLPPPDGQDYPVDGQLPPPDGQDYPIDGQLPPPDGQEYSVDGQPPTNEGGTPTGPVFENHEVETEISGTSEWRLIEADGVQLLEISIPLRLRHLLNLDREESFLLIEHDGFVRLGARLGEYQVENVTTYNNAAFTTIRSLVEETHTAAQ